MQRQLLIDKRFCGPPNSANGGYTAGLLAANLPFQPEVTLRQPPPLNQSLELKWDDHHATLTNGGVLIAEAKVTDFQLTVPKAVSYADAVKYGLNGQTASPFSYIPHCFVCGVERTPGDGLRIFPGPISENKVVTNWIPAANLGDTNQSVQLPFLWAALDCPGIWAVQDFSNYYLLGRMAAKSIIPVKTNQPHTVSGWVIQKEGRKVFTGTAIYNETGEVCAMAKGTWIRLRS